MNRMALLGQLMAGSAGTLGPPRGLWVGGFGGAGGAVALAEAGSRARPSINRVMPIINRLMPLTNGLMPSINRK